MMMVRARGLVERLAKRFEDGSRFVGVVGRRELNFRKRAGARGPAAKRDGKQRNGHGVVAAHDWHQRVGFSLVASAQ